MRGQHRSWASPGAQFAEKFALLVAFRGLDAERELLELFGEGRLTELYDGAEPRFGELREIQRVLQVPFSAFETFETARFPEVETAIAEVLFHAHDLGPDGRKRLADRICELTVEARIDAGEGEGSSQSLLSLLRKSGRV